MVGIFVKGKKKGLHGFVYTYSTHMYTHILAHTKIYNENEGYEDSMVPAVGMSKKRTI